MTHFYCSSFSTAQEQDRSVHPYSQCNYSTTLPYLSIKPIAIINKPLYSTCDGRINCSLPAGPAANACMVQLKSLLPCAARYRSILLSFCRKNVTERYPIALRSLPSWRTNCQRRLAAKLQFILSTAVPRRRNPPGYSFRYPV